MPLSVHPVSCLCTREHTMCSSPNHQLTRACTTLYEAGWCHGLLPVQCCTASSPQKQAVALKLCQPRLMCVQTAMLFSVKHTQTSCYTKVLSAKTHGCSDDDSSSPVKQLLDSVPAAVKQHAVRGRAGILKQLGDSEDAEALLSELVQSKEQFADVQHLAQADYGALLHEQGKLKVCAGVLCMIVPDSCPTKPGVGYWFSLSSRWWYH